MIRKELPRTLLILPTLLILTIAVLAQQRRPAPTPAPAGTPSTSSNTPMPGMTMSSIKSGPKPYKDVITDKAISRKGLFTVHRIEDKWYFEIADSMLGRDILVVNRLAKASAGMRNFFFGYAGDQIGNNVIRFDRGPNNKVFLKKISYDEMSKDSSMPMYKAVMNSNIQPIAQSFDISSLGKDSTGVVLDVTGFINTDNDILNFEGNSKRIFQIGSFQGDKSYINAIKAYPLNIEIKTVKTYSKGAPAGGFGVPANPFAAPTGGNLTMEINSSLVLLPKKAMQPRYYDPRVGYFTRSYTDFDADPQGVKDIRMVTRWRLEPKDEDIEKYKRGELVEPKKQIVYYIDPATPKKWVPYLIQGVNDWQASFEKAGFKNAIIAKVAPSSEQDSEWSLEDARYSAIVYKPSDVANASGPHVHDPRSGEIIESHINWYHNVMKLLRNWYFIQTAAVDPRARKMEFDDELMGQLIRFVSSHEVGHTLGLRHNFGSSSTVPVEKLRDKKWVEENGHTPSIMDYARFNYVAQPEDNISEIGLFPRIGDYDNWAIEWGYKWLPQAKSAEDEKAILNKMTIEKLKNKRFWFGTETDPNDPRCQNEDIGDNAMKAGAYGIKNLQRILPNIMQWSREPNEDYDNATELYREVTTQFNRYLGHAAKNIGGIYTTPKTVEQSGPVFEMVPKQTQKEAVAFLSEQALKTPTWLINKEIMQATGNSPLQTIGNIQDGVMGRMISSGIFSKLLRAEAEYPEQAYNLSEYLNDIKKAVFTELPGRKPIDIYRRGLQRSFVEKLGSTISDGGSTPITAGGITFSISSGANKNSDIYAVVKGFLRSLSSEIRTSIPGYTSTINKQHLQDLSDRINDFLDPKK